MIERRTLLILGAGTSQPYGYPLGSGLRAHLVRLATNQGQQFQNLVNLGFPQNDIRVFGETFARSGVGSIDAFLAQQPKFAALGKCAIAEHLVTFEDPTKLFTPTDTVDHWYAYLWEHIRAGAQSVAGISNSKLSIVTFNYDRSLEYFLLEAMRNFYGCQDSEAHAAIAGIPIIHIYGSLGEFPVQGKTVLNSRHYALGADTAQVRAAADQLHLITAERNTRADIFAKVQRLFNDAERVGIFGFGFDPTNCALLGLEKVMVSRKTKAANFERIVASTVGFTDYETRSNLGKLVGERFVADVTPYPFKTLRTLRESGLLL